MIPTPEEPLILIYPGRIPAMKNSIQLSLDNEGHVTSVGRSKAVRIALTQFAGSSEQQRIRQGFEVIPLPWRIGAWVKLGFYLAPKSKAVITKQDADNAYTTIQETWAGGVCENDRQVFDFHVTQNLIRNKNLLYSVAFVYALDPELPSPTDSFIKLYNKFKDMKTWQLSQQAYTPDRVLEKYKDVMIQSSPISMPEG
jgi:hypothetical protein